jgi:hypothetical protein
MMASMRMVELPPARPAGSALTISEVRTSLRGRQSSMKVQRRPPHRARVSIICVGAVSGVGVGSLHLGVQLIEYPLVAPR